MLFNFDLIDNSNDPVDIYVDGGSLSSPYYNFFLDSEGTNPLQNLELDISKSYKFQRLDNATSHPFYISNNGYQSESSDNLIFTGDGDYVNGITGVQSFTIEFNGNLEDIGTLNYYSTNQSSMLFNFDLIDNSNDPVNIYVDGGNFSSPYFNFFLDSEGTNPLQDLELDIS